ncbi:MAG: hypothetical protein AAGA09_09405 [Pseudomonadota bacterium]
MIPIRYILILACFFLNACQIKANEIETENLITLISGTSSHSSSEGAYNKPLPIKSAVFIDTHAAGGLQDLGICGEALSTPAVNSFDYDKLRAPYEKYAMDALLKSGVLLDQKSNMRLAFHFDVIDVPISLKKGSETIYCLVDFHMDLSGNAEFVMKHDETLSFSKRLSIHSAEKLYFVEVSELKASIESEIDERVARAAPTLSGKVGDSCGYFQDEPEEHCATIYRLKLRHYERKLQCADNSAEEAEAQKNIDETIVKLRGLPPEPENSEYFTLCPEGANQSACK